MGALELTATWPVDNVAAAVLVDGVVADRVGATGHRFRLASITKPVAAWAMLLAVEEGIVELDGPIGQPGCTLRHLLAHAGGYPFDGPPVPIIEPARKRIYSNTGIELASDTVAAAAAMDFADYLRAGVLEPLGMVSSTLDGSSAHGMWSTVDDATRFVSEVVSPRLLSAATAEEAIRPHFPDLGGIVPGVGRFETCPWGLGFEIRGQKTPHWTGTHNSASTCGHFGGAGTMMWIDPDHHVGLVALTDRPFDEWASEALRRWRELSDAVLDEFAGQAGPVVG